MENQGIIRSGCVFWIVAATIIAGIVLYPLGSVLGNVAAGWRAGNEAQKVAEEGRKLAAQADLETARAYNEAAGRSLKADTYRAHPELYLVDAVKWIFIVAVAIVVVLALLFMWWNYQENKTANELIRSSRR